ncbi:MAG: hypothetical protein JRI87_10690, partial [Deltaproteobacteria bacterium]|nr:hypothetical protein [Deltaproteobacteria bacterium]
GLIDYYDFFGKEPPNLYPTHEEASQSAQELGIKNGNEYKKRYNEDPRLPSTPAKTYKYKGWVDWFDFLGKERKK